MSQETVEIVRRAFERYAATGEPAWENLHEEIEVHDHDIMDGSQYRGHAGFARWFEDWGAAWSEFSMEPEEFLDAGERVVMVFRMKATGRASGVPVERQDAMVWEIRDEKVTRLDYYNSREQALEAAAVSRRDQPS